MVTTGGNWDEYTAHTRVPYGFVRLHTGRLMRLRPHQGRRRPSYTRHLMVFRLFLGVPHCVGGSQVGLAVHRQQQVQASMSGRFTGTGRGGSISCRGSFYLSVVCSAGAFKISCVITLTRGYTQYSQTLAFHTLLEWISSRVPNCYIQRYALVVRIIGICKMLFVLQLVLTVVV